jgi:hypothetical protein
MKRQSNEPIIRSNEPIIRRLDAAFEASKNEKTTEAALAAWYRAFLNGPSK